MKKTVKIILKLWLSDSQLYKLRMKTMRVLSLKRSISTKYYIESFGNYNEDTFFGYYDISPFSSNGNAIIYLSRGNNDDDAKIIYSDLKTNEAILLAVTKAWNWQQGSRLRWDPRVKNRVMYNDFEDGLYVTRVLNIDTLEFDTLEWALYDIDCYGNLGITIDFARLGVLRPGYGYTKIPYVEPSSLKEECIKIVDISTGKCIKTITYERISNRLQETDINYSKSYINHLSFSPLGDKFLFFWVKIDSAGIHRANLLVFDINKDNLTVIEKDLSVSHYDWIDNESMIITGYDNKRNCKYYIYNCNGDRKQLLPNILDGDGHPTWLGNNEIITDTYMDKYGFQRILNINIKEKTSRVLIDIYSTYKFNGERRCDLHPRLNRENNIICFDANVKGNRKVFLLKGWR